MASSNYGFPADQIKMRYYFRNNLNLELFGIQFTLSAPSNKSNDINAYIPEKTALEMNVLPTVFWASPASELSFIWVMEAAKTEIERT